MVICSSVCIDIFFFIYAHLCTSVKRRSYCKMFYVAIGGDWCSVVPQSWINIDEKLCAWPSHGINVSKAIKKSLPPKPSWESALYKYLLGPYKSFEEAKIKEKEAEFLSSDDGNIVVLQNKENNLPLKRKKKRKFYDSFDTDIESADTDSIFENKRNNVPTTLKKSCDKELTLKQNVIVKKIVPDPPSNFIINNKNSDIDIQLEQDQCSSPFSDINESQSLNYGDYISQSEESVQDNIQKDSQRDIQRGKYLERSPKNVNISTNATSLNTEEKRSLPVIKHINYNPALNIKIKKKKEHESCKGKSDSALQMQEYRKQKLIDTDIINGKETSNKEENVQGYLTSINRILDTVLVINNKMDSMPAMNRKLDSILAVHDVQNPLVANCFFDLLPNFPLNSMEEFQKLCTDLNQNEELQKQFQKKIRSIGGKSPENHLVNCLIVTLTNELAKQLTWEGQRQTEGIKNTAFSNIITGTISNMYSTSNYYNLKTKFSEWLRRAGDRLRYQLKKLEHPA